MTHLTDWTLEQLAEGELSPLERERAEDHLQECPRCAGELAGYRALFEALSSVSRPAPSAAFADAVMARVRLRPAEHPALAWLRRLLPSTRRGWALLLGALAAPGVPVVALLAWLLARPMVTPAGLVRWAADGARDLALAAFVHAGEWLSSSGAAARAWDLVEPAAALPRSALAGGALLLAVGVPLSAWTLYKLLRTPTRGTTHAH